MKKVKENKVAVNGMFFAAYRLLNVLFPLITSVYVARVLLPSGTGRVAYAQNIVTYFTLIAALGLPTYGTREIAKTIGDEKRYNTTFFELFSINAISTTICIIGYYLLCFAVPLFRADIKLYLVAGLAIVLNYFNIDWLYQAREEYKYISIRGIIVKGISVILLFLLVKNASDYIVYAGLYCFVLGGNYFVNIFGLRKRIKFKKYTLILKKHWKPLIVLFATTVAIELYTMLDTTMIGAICSDEIVGYYSYAMKTSKILITILAAATTVLLPKLSNYFEKKTEQYIRLANKGLSFVLVTSIPLATILCLNAFDVVIFLYGESYIGAVITLKILSVLIIPISLSTYLGVQILCSANLEKKMLLAVCIGAVTNIVLNSYLIPRYQHNGAAIASVISEVVVTFVEIFFVQKYIHLSVMKKMLYTIGAAEILVIFGTLLIQNIVDMLVVRLFVSGLFSVVVFGLVVCFSYHIGLKSIKKIL